MQTKIKKNSRLSLVFITALTLVSVLTLSACSTNNTDAKVNNNTNNITEETLKPGDDLVITISDILETPKFYPLTVDGTRMEVFALKVDDTIRTAFNTCQICNGSPKAYFEQIDNTVQCQNCGNKFEMDKIGLESGGCNPVPILDSEKTVTDQSITIPYDILEANAYRFPQNWKK